MSTPVKSALLAEIEAFMAASGLSATRFGVLAAGDTKFVKTLREGRKARGATQDRVRQWMREQSGD